MIESLHMTATWMEMVRMLVSFVCLLINISALISAARDRRAALLASDSMLIVVAGVGLRREYMRCIKQVLVNIAALVALLVASTPSPIADLGMAVMAVVSVIIAGEAIWENYDRALLTGLTDRRPKRYRARRSPPSE